VNGEASASRISLAAALLPLLVMLACLVAGSRIMPLDAPLLVTAMLVAAAVAGAIAWRRGHGFDEIQRIMGEKLAAALPVLLILLSIGLLIGSWVASGTIPMLVHLGLEWIDPRFLLITGFLVTCGMSLATGTSWGSAGTIGVALMGMALALDVNLAAMAGAVISGAYVGDKLSPLSDSTNICAIAAGADLYKHIRHLMYTSIPSFLVCCVAYTAAGLTMHAPAAAAVGEAPALGGELSRAFDLSLWTLLPPLVVGICMWKKVAPTLAMCLSSLTAILVAIAVQGMSLAPAIESAINGFRHGMLPLFSAADAAAPSAAFVKLVDRGGLYSMIGTFVVILAAFLLAAALEASGALRRILEALLAAARGVFGLIAATAAAAATMIALTSHNGVTALVVGELFQPAYRQRKLAAINLSRTLEDAATITEPIMPWTVSAVYMATTVGVPTIEYAPWAVFCYAGPVFTLLIAGTYSKTGFGIAPLETERTCLSS
jgi:NhaC family Na+:H+ antiporter